MTITLFFDTETSGLPNKKLPFSDPDQPWIVQLGFLLTDGHTIYQSANFLIRSEGRKMNPFAEKVHGISTSMADSYGLDEIDAISIFARCVDYADLIVAHNYQFDQHFINNSYARLGYELDAQCFNATPHFCTMLGTTDYCKLPGRYGKNKWPKLTELHELLFQEEIIGSHDAMVDVRATARCYYHLERQGFFEGKETEEK